MKRPRIITRRVALVVRCASVFQRGGVFLAPVPELWAFSLGPFDYVPHMRTRVRVCARPMGAGARVYSLGPLSGNS
jgi:hypothetical protein